jgi:AhpD family alkylhydroperoxidase
MDRKTKELVGIAAAVAGHCRKCFAYHHVEAEKLGVDKGDIKEAIELAQALRKAGDADMDEYAGKLISKNNKGAHARDRTI